MTWSIETSRGNEAAKIRFEIVPYTRGAGLDIGCGPFSPFRHFIGIDQAPGATLQADGSRLPIFQDGIFDFVFSSHFLEHVEDYRAALAEWWRVIREGGHLVLYLPHRDHYPRIGQPGANPDHKHDFAPADITDAVLALGDCEQLVDEVRAGGDEYSFLQVYRKRCGPAVPLLRPASQRPSAGIVRPGAYGDSLWASSVASHLSQRGYSVTVYTEAPGEEVLRHDPHIDRIVVTSSQQFPELRDLAKFWDHESRKHAVFVNLAESVEKNLLATASDLRFYWPAAVRRDIFGGSYFDRIHDIAEVPRELRVRFYPSQAELSEAAMRAGLLRDGGRKVAVLAAAGSSPPKFWPYLEQLADALIAQGYAVTVLGDLRGWEPDPRPHLRLIGERWPIRDAIAFAQQADLVIGQETALLNAVAMEPMRKVVLLSHSTPQNLTYQWTNTRSLFGSVPCYPCHRLHQSFAHCTRDAATNVAACQAAISVEAVLDAALAPIETHLSLAA